MSTTFDDLPQELLSRIIQFSTNDRKTLYRLCLTSIHFIHEARLHLYATVQVVRGERSDPWLPSLDTARFRKLLSTFITHNPSLAKYVKTFLYNKQLQKDDPSSEDLRHALRLMINVKWLELNTTIPHFPQNFFQGCAFQLDHFRCKFASSDGATIYNLLSMQPSLRSLHIDGLTQDFPSDCCTALKSLIVEDWRNVLQILPGRSILVLELLQVDPSFDSVPPSITAELGNLTHFTFESETPYDFLEIVAPYLTNLIILRIIGRDDSGPSGETIGQEPGILCKFPNLETFVWSRDYYDSYHIELTARTFEIAVKRNARVAVLVDMWFLKMPKLAVVYFREYGYEHSPKHYICWERDKKGRRVYPDVALDGKSFYTK